jgi:hypothetical protein
VPVAPAASCALGSDRTHTSNNEYPESPGVPARNGFNGFLRALPGDRALLPPSPCGLKVLSSPVEPNEPPQDLTPASRRQDHTTSPSASSAVVLHAANRSRRAIRPALASHAQHCRVHRIPPRVRDDHDTPLWWGGMATVLELIWVRGNKYFSENPKEKTRQQTARRANQAAEFGSPYGGKPTGSAQGAARRTGPAQSHRFIVAEQQICASLMRPSTWNHKSVLRPILRDGHFAASSG